MSILIMLAKTSSTAASINIMHINYKLSHFLNLYIIYKKFFPVFVKKQRAVNLMVGEIGFEPTTSALLRCSNQLSYSSGYRNRFCYSCFVFYVVKYSKLFCSCKPLKNNFFIGQPLKKSIQSLSLQNYHIILDYYDMLLQIWLSSDQ